MAFAICKYWVGKKCVRFLPLANFKQKKNNFLCSIVHGHFKNSILAPTLTRAFFELTFLKDLNEYQLEYFMHMFYIYFKKAHACTKICDVCCVSTIKERVCPKWFSKFRRDLLVQDAHENNQMTDLIKLNPSYKTNN